MGEGRFPDFERCGFVGKLAGGIREVMAGDALEGLKVEVERDGDRVLSAGRHRVVVLDLGGPVAVKAFGRQGAAKDAHDRKRGSKAARSHEAAAFLETAGVGTPAPLGYLEKWSGSRLLESYYFSRYVPQLTSFKDELIKIYRQTPECDRLVALLEHIGPAIRKMHEAGFWHRDLGNQNMELRQRVDGRWGEVQFIDLNRGRIREQLSEKERAQDFSRLRLPSAFLEVLVRIYWAGRAPEEFTRELERKRRHFRWWEASRRWRHPTRPKPVPGPMGYLPMQDIWIWDRQSAQASVTMNRQERRRYYPPGRHGTVAAAVLKSLPGVWKEYGELRESAFRDPVKLSGRIGMSLEATDLDFDRQVEFLRPLGKIPVWIRFCHHEGKARWEETVARVRSLVEAGHELGIALVQDRRAVLDPESWKGFLSYVVSELEGQVSLIEVCHAVNRMKWGVHSPAEHGALLEPLVGLQERFPHVKFSGPACIDFEYHYVLAALAKTPAQFRYAALSHHLYVDRRGAPENRQGKFGLVEKAALLKAIARHSGVVDDRVVVSEVNWPVKGSGVWSPVDATYLMPGQAESPLNVSAEDYGYFMLRYLVLALCSGMVDQVYWWRLVAHGFGLVDERAEGEWRPRAGYGMLQYFLATLGEATFREKIGLGENVYALRFERPEGEVVMLWCNGIRYRGPWPIEAKEVRDCRGEVLEGLREVGEAPVYLFSPAS